MQKSDITGYFGPDSMTWQLYREPIVSLGSFRALLLQVAHPAVAAGVARFSNFKKDGLGRGFRTFKAMATLYFGTQTQARGVAARLHKMHNGIRGHYPVPDTSAPVPYTANDPDLLLWVLATLLETTLQVFEQAPVAGLPADWRERFYEESKITANLLGIPPERYPADLPAFRAYFAAMLDGDLLGSSPVSRELTESIINHKYSYAPLARLMSVGWLPAPLCERLGIQVPYPPAARWSRFLRRVSRFYRLLPRRLRYAPAYYQGLHRIAVAEQKSPPLLGTCYNWLVRRVNMPLGLDPA